MTAPIILCADGSDLSNEALRAGLGLLRDNDDVRIVTVVDADDPMLVTGTGMASGTMSMDDYQRHDAAIVTEGQRTVDEVAKVLGLTSAQPVVLRGEAGPALCTYATDEQAAAIVIGSRGRGGLRRALLGSVSDHVVRNAPCPVVVTA